MVEWVFEYLISVGFETHGTLQLPFQMKIDQGWKSKEMWKNTFKISYEKICILLIELESSISSISKSIQDLKNCWISITTVFTQIEHFSFKQKLYFKYYPKEELWAIFAYTVWCGVNTHSSSKELKKNVKIGNSILKFSSHLKLLLIVVLLIVYLLHVQCFHFNISPVWESAGLESADGAKQTMLSYIVKFAVLGSVL